MLVAASCGLHVIILNLESEARIERAWAPPSGHLVHLAIAAICFPHDG